MSRLSPSSNRSQPPVLAVIADDLTGSCDTAAQFSRYGMEVAVTGATHLDPDLPGDLLVVNTASRGLSPGKAREVVDRTVRRLLQQNRRLVYKKIDSTLKGPWCKEMATIMGMTRPDLVIMAPAFPTWGRTIKGGILHLHGQRMMAQPARLRLSEGIDTADLIGRLKVEFGSQVELMRREVVRQRPASIEKRIQAARRKGHRVLLFDVESEDDLRQIALSGRWLDQEVLWVGSAGLARFLPLSWGYSHLSVNQDRPAVSGPILLICGSLNPANKVQLQQLSQRGLATTLTIQDEDAGSDPRVEDKLSFALAELSQGKPVALCLRLDSRIRSLNHLQQLQQALQSTSGRILDRLVPGAIVLVGGDTALKIYERSGARGIRILGEVEPGIPYGRWIGGQLDTLPVVTKAGGFGNQGTLSGIFEFLKAGPS